VDHVGIDCLVNTIDSRPDGKAIDILGSIMTELKDNSVITAAVESGVVMVIESTIFSRMKSFSSIKCSLDTLAAIARHSAAYQDKVFKSGVLDRLGSKLMDKMSLYIEMPFLSLLDAMSLHGKSTRLVRKIIELGLAPFLAKIIACVGKIYCHSQSNSLLKLSIKTFQQSM
jgi:hypothetical protein